MKIKTDVVTLFLATADDEAGLRPRDTYRYLRTWVRPAGFMISVLVLSEFRCSSVNLRGILVDKLVISVLYY